MNNLYDALREIDLPPGDGRHFFIGHAAWKIMKLWIFHARTGQPRTRLLL